jgi:hypothetical protein
MKKTAWFPPYIKPVHVGLYEVTIDAWSIFEARWDGNYFRESELGARYARNIFYWRGLTEEAK